MPPAGVVVIRCRFFDRPRVSARRRLRPSGCTVSPPLAAALHRPGTEVMARGGWGIMPLAVCDRLYIYRGAGTSEAIGVCVCESR